MKLDTRDRDRKADSPPPWRLLVHGARDGAWNMAVDQVLLESCGQPGTPPATLRLYSWSPTALTLGRNQSAEGSHDPRFLRTEGIDLVRRPTGGRAVLHENERTYSFVGPLEGDGFGGDLMETYRKIARALEIALSGLGVDAHAEVPAASGRRKDAPISCFDMTSAHELAVGGRKLAGSAQFRSRRAFLQHGSIPLRLDAARLSSALGLEVDASRFTDVERCLGRVPSEGEMDAAIRTGFASMFGVRWVSSELTPEELVRAERLRSWKYNSASWTLDATLGTRETNLAPEALVSEGT